MTTPLSQYVDYMTSVIDQDSLFNNFFVLKQPTPKPADEILPEDPSSSNDSPVNPPIDENPLLDEATPLSDEASSSTPKTESKVASLQFLVKQRIDQLNLPLDRLRKSRPYLLVGFLEDARTFKTWNSLRESCPKDEIKKNCARLLLQNFKKINDTNPEKELLEEIFNKAFQDSSAESKEFILQHKRTIAPHLETRTNKAQRVGEKTLCLLHSIISNPAVRVAGGIILAYYTWTTCYKVIDLVTLFFTSIPFSTFVPAPIISVATTLYNYKWVVLVCSFPVYLLSDNYPSLHAWVFKPIFKTTLYVCFLPLKIFCTIAQFTGKSLMAIGSASKIVEGYKKTIVDARLGREGVQARIIWVTAMLQKTA